VIIVGLTGYMGAGKDTVGKILVENYGFHRVAFADPIKELALILNPWLLMLYGDSRRPLKKVVEHYGWDDAKQIAAVREYIQRLGTEGCRHIFGDDCWIEKAFRTIGDIRKYGDNDNARIVITDVRHPLEQKRIYKETDSTIWRIERPGCEPGEHDSEQHAGYLGDVVLKNEGDLDHLAVIVKEQLKEQFIFGINA